VKEAQDVGGTGGKNLSKRIFKGSGSYRLPTRGGMMGPQGAGKRKDKLPARGREKYREAKFYRLVTGHGKGYAKQRSPVSAGSQG